MFQEHARLAHRRSDDLVLLLANGDSIVVRDTTTEGPGSYLYWLESIDEPSGYFVIGMTGYEDRGSIAINRRNGWRKEFPFDLPVFAATHLVAAVVPIGTAYWEPEIAIYEPSGDTLAEVFRVESARTANPFARGDTLWGPADPHWVGNELHLHTEERLPLDAQRQWPGDSVVVAKRGGRWELQRLK